MEKQKVAVLTLGCSKNVVDSEVLLGKLSANNLDVTTNLNEANVCIINTCGFIKPSVEESLQVILEAVELKKRGKIEKLLTVGCLTQRFSQTLAEQFPEVDFFAGVDSAESIVKFLKQDKELKTELLGERLLLTPKHYAYLKISEGCNRECSFCSIPSIRGNHKSRSLEEITAEARRLAGQGVRELVLIAQDTTYYGRDIYGQPTLPKLLRELSDIPGISWIRLMYAYPAGFPEEALDVIAERDNICKYVDIPLQHISDKVLKSMRRGTSRKIIEQLIEKIRTKIPTATIRTTFIVGYPNETEEDFRELLDFVATYRLDRVGVFTYSQEDGTSAFPLGDPIPQSEKIQRRNELMALQQRISLEKNQQLVGKELKVLVDERNGKNYYGRTEMDAPEVDNLVLLSSKKEVLVGSFCKAKIARAKAYDLFAEVVSQT
jgi:ribosomal protein S12 methylthiotransferase